MDYKLSVVIPLYNNALAILELTERIYNQVNDVISYELIFVNDCSTDNTHDVLKSLANGYSSLRFINLEKNIGQQSATLEGMRKARGEMIIVMDGDLQDQPELIPHLLKVNSSSGISIFVKRLGAYQSRSRMLTSRLFKFILQIFTGLHPNAGSFYLIDSQVKERLLAACGHLKKPYLTVMIALLSDRIEYLEAIRDISQYPSSFTFSKRLKYAYIAAFCAIKTRRIKKQHLKL